MKIGVLTSSRADYGIYLPLLKRLKTDPFFNLRLIVFGTHLSKEHGYTYDQIIKDGFTNSFMIDTVPSNDSPESISRSIGEATVKFSEFWSSNKNDFDLIFSLGDRYEMFAATSSTVPFNIRLAHLHGGESTEGAIDNVFRHSISLMSELHFTALEPYAARVKEIRDSGENIYVVGALSLDNLADMQLLSVEEFKKQYEIDLSVPTILITYHPETINYANNAAHLPVLFSVLDKLNKNYSLVITMPNADTFGNQVRKGWKEFVKGKNNIYLIENFGTLGYFSCMKHVSFIMGNSSSGIIEAASFNKYVIDIGDRQKGRLSGENVFHCRIDEAAMLETVKKIKSLPPYTKGNIYGKGDASGK